MSTEKGSCFGENVCFLCMLQECKSGPGTKRVTGIELESLIYAVKDLLPGLSDDFVKVRSDGHFLQRDIQ